MAVQGGEGDVVKVDEAQPRYARAREHDRRPTPDSPAADNDDGRRAHARDALLAEEGIVSCQLLAYEFLCIFGIGNRQR
jgi:hypothetical protein